MKKGQSRMNSHHLALIPTLVMALTYGGAVDTQIVVLTPYKGQLRLLRKLLAPAITVATVDSSQGKEYDFVILDLVNPGGRSVLTRFSHRPQPTERSSLES